MALLQTLEQFGGMLVAFTRMSGTICLKCSPILDVSFLRMLPEFYNLRNLHLADSFIGDQFMLSPARNIQDTNWPTCPMLESLVLESCPLSSGKVIDLMRSRNSGPLPITPLTIGCCSVVNAIFRSLLRLRISFTPLAES